MLTNYWRTKPTAFSPATIQHYIDEIRANVGKQETERLKQPVPADKFIDTRTMTMWDRKPAWVSGAQYKPSEGKCYCSSRLGYYCELKDPNWQERAKDLGTEEDFKRLIDGWDLDNRCGTTKQAVPCPNPLEYLRKEVGFDTTSAPAGTPREQVAYVWLGPIPVSRIEVPVGCGSYHDITRIDLIYDTKPGPRVFHSWLYSKDPEKYFAFAMSRQAVAPGTYWWPLGGR